jgi:hypothetical protein
MGYRVTAVDLNETSDLLSDWRRIQLAGYWPRFDCRSVPPITDDRKLAARLDLSSLHDQQFIICDTAQYIRLPTIEQSWRYAHLLVMPVTPNTQELPNYVLGIKFLQALPRPRPLMTILPCKVNRKGTRVSDKSLQFTLQDWQSLAEDRIYVPPADLSDVNIPEEETVKNLETRWILSSFVHNGKQRCHTADFLTRVDVSFTWIIKHLERGYGPLPAPELPPVSVNPFERSKTLLSLKEELSRRRAPAAVSA